MQTKLFRLCPRDRLATKTRLVSACWSSVCYGLACHVAAVYLQASVLATETAENANTLSAAEIDAGFESLFNGRDLNDWSQKGNWKVENGTIYRAADGGFLTYAAQPLPDDFELRFQWKVSKGSNSGVYYRPGQYEYQILDNADHKDGQNPRTSAASLYFCMAPSEDATKPPGQWNTGRVICQGTTIQHWLNGKKVVGFDYADPQWASNVELLQQLNGDLSKRSGQLHLQDHGDPVWFRGIKLRKLAPNERLDDTLVEPAEIPASALKREQEIIQWFRSQNQ